MYLVRLEYLSVGFICVHHSRRFYSAVKHVGKEKNIIYVTVYSESCKRVLKLNSVNRRI